MNTTECQDTVGGGLHRLTIHRTSKMRPVCGKALVCQRRHNLHGSAAPFDLGFGVYIAHACSQIMNVYFLRAWAQQRSVGILRALGASPRQIASLFLIQGLTSGLVGGALGILAARGAVWGLSRLTIRLPQVFYLERLPIGWAQGDSWWVLSAAVLTGLLAVILPALRMTKVDPVEVVRRVS